MSAQRLPTLKGESLQAYRLVNSKFPPIALFDDVADADEFELLYQIQALTTAQLVSLGTDDVAALTTAQIVALGSDQVAVLTTAQVQALTSKLDYFVAENAKTARAFLKLIAIDHPLAKPLQEIELLGAEDSQLEQPLADSEPVASNQRTRVVSWYSSLTSPAAVTEYFVSLPTRCGE